jgi:hypothetical protein
MRRQSEAPTALWFSLEQAHPKRRRATLAAALQNLKFYDRLSRLQIPRIDDDGLTNVEPCFDLDPIRAAPASRDWFLCGLSIFDHHHLLDPSKGHNRVAGDGDRGAGLVRNYFRAHKRSRTQATVVTHIGFDG